MARDVAVTLPRSDGAEVTQKPGSSALHDILRSSLAFRAPLEQNVTRIGFPDFRAQQEAIFTISMSTVLFLQLA